jgi:hypothetical protein
MPRTGRPRKYEHPVRLVVWLEARELKQLDATAKAAGVPMTSAWARRVLLEVAARDAEAPAAASRAQPGRAACGRVRATSDRGGG